jgi:hypothetical protein
MNQTFLLASGSVERVRSISTEGSRDRTDSKMVKSGDCSSDSDMP